MKQSIAKAVDTAVVVVLYTALCGAVSPRSVCAAAVADTTKKYSAPPVSMGQPPRFRTAIGLETGYAFTDENAGWRVFGNVSPRGKWPHLGIDLMSLELGVLQSEGDWNVDFGYYVRFPFIRLGAEFAVPDDKFSGVASLQYSLRRGGIFGHGEELRVDYRTSGDEHAVLVGIVFNEPFRKHRDTRPLKKYTAIPEGSTPAPKPQVAAQALPANLEQSLQTIQHSISWLDQLLTPRFIKGNVREQAEDYRAHIRMPGHTLVEEDSTYHSEFAKALTIALDGDSVTGDELARAAENVIFTEVVAPYNGHFGANKMPRLPTGYISAAVADFDSVLANTPALNGSNAKDKQRLLATEVFRQVLVAIEDAADNARSRWKTTNAVWLQRAQFAWLPLNYGLRPEDYDTQTEWDSVVSRVTGQSMTDCNHIEYLINEQFHPHLKEMINETEVYQVLVVHDFQAWDGSDPDPIGWDAVADGYLKAFTEAVKAIDRGDRELLPQYQLYIDQNFYALNKSYKIITYLEHLYESSTVDLKDKEAEAKVEAAHAEMIAAIKASPSFRDMDDNLLKRLFTVNVNVTNPWDPSFALDISMRDHRKFAFRDVFEDDPGRGVGILTGTGVGQHYQPPTWEDRGMVIRGPALLELKRAVRELCENQGFTTDEIPFYLWAQPLSPDYRAQCDALRKKGWTVSVMIAVNHTGYGRKAATAMRAAIYNLAPKGSVLVAIDSLWLSDFWAAMFISAALRGAHVYAVAPSPVNAPASGNTVLFLMRQNLELLFEARTFLLDDLQPVDGKIHVGLYTHDYSVDDVVERASALVKGLDEYNFIREDFPLNDEAFSDFRKEADARIKAAETKKAESREDEQARGEVKPFLHMKTQFFGTRVAMQVLRERAWSGIVERYVDIRLQQVAGEASPGLTPSALVTFDPATGRPMVREQFDKYLATLPPEERDDVIYAFTIGSMNQDRRGMISDGEILACIAGYPALIGVLDMINILSTSNWPQNASHFDDIFPPPSLGTTMQRLTRYLQSIF